VGASTQIPLEGSGINFSYWLAGQDLPTSERPGGDFRAVTPGYFDALGIPVVAGRTFTRADRSDAPPVVVIDEALARQQFPNGGAVGRMMHVSLGGSDAPREIIGVVGSVKQRALDVPDAPGYYLPIGQVSWSSMRIVLRTSGAPASFAPAFRAELAAMDPLLSARSIRTLEQHFVEAVGSPRFNTLLVGGFAAIAALLAITGLYGVMSYAVSCRTREIGVRMALGAGANEVRRSVAWDGLKLAGIGVALGLAAAAGLTRLLTDLLFGVSPLDLGIFAAAALGFVAVALLGSYVPARRASRVDPLEALRAE
jgi:putative ABC transport system permease protein